MATVGNVVFQISADIRNLQGQLRTMEGNFQSSFGKIQNVAQQVAGTLGVSLSAVAFIGFIKGSLEAIGNLKDLGDSTGFAASTLLKLKPILNDAGTSVEEFAKGVNVLQKDIVDGSPEVVSALDKMGLSIGDMLAFADDPEGLVDKLAKGFANLATQADKVAVARTLLARGGPKIGVALQEIFQRGGISAIRAEPSIISDEEFAAIDQLGRDFDTLKIKAEAFAAVSILGLINQFKELSKEASTFFQLLTSPSRVIGEAIGKKLARGAPEEKPTPQLLTGDIGARGGGGVLTETNAQKEFKKALDEQIQSLHSQVLALTQSKEAAIANAAEIIKSKAAAIGLSESSKELADRLSKFRSESLQIAQGQLADSLIKQNQSLEIQIATMTEGKGAAEQLALKYALLDAKLRDIGPAAEAAAKKQRELNDEAARAIVPQTLKELGEAKETAQKKQVLLGITFNADEAVRSAIEAAIDKFASEKDPRVKALALEAAINLKPELDTSRLKSIQTELGIGLGLDKEFSQILNRTFTNTFDVATSKVQRLEDALQQAKSNGVDPMSEGVQKLVRELDQARFDQVAASLQRDLKIAANEAQVFGRSFDLGSANIQAIENQLQQLIHQGLSSANAEVQKLAEQLRSAKLADVFIDLNREIQISVNEAEVLGGAIDLPAERIDELTNAIKRLIAEGFSPLSPEIQKLKAELEDARAAQRFAEAFENIGQSLSDALNDLSKGAKFKDVAKNLASQINRALTDALITKPFQDFLKKLANDIFGSTSFLSNLPAGFGQRPSGVAGPSLPGGFFSTQGGAQAAQIESAATILETGATGIQTAAASFQTIAASFQSATVQFATAVQEFVASSTSNLTGGVSSIGQNLGLIPNLLQGDIPFIGQSLGLIPDLLTGAIFHEGGIVGSSNVPSRVMSKSVFYDAPRYHTGAMNIGANEMPAILERGETVIPKGMRFGGSNVTVNQYFPNANNAESFRRNKAQWGADVALAVRKGNKQL